MTYTIGEHNEAQPLRCTPDLDAGNVLTFIRVLEDFFPWLGTDDDANGADTVDAVNELWAGLCASHAQLLAKK